MLHPLPPQRARTTFLLASPLQFDLPRICRYSSHTPQPRGGGVWHSRGVGLPAPSASPPPASSQKVRESVVMDCIAGGGMIERSVVIGLCRCCSITTAAATNINTRSTSGNNIFQCTLASLSSIDNLPPLPSLQSQVPVPCCSSRRNAHALQQPHPSALSKSGAAGACGKRVDLIYVQSHLGGAVLRLTD